MPQLKPIGVFLLFVLAFAIALQGLMLSFGVSRYLMHALMWSVGLAGLATLQVLKLPLSSLGWRWGPAKHHLIAFLLPLGYGAVAYVGAAAAGLAEFPTAEGVTRVIEQMKVQSMGPTLGFIIALLLIPTAGMVTSMATALGEEIGWRGFLTPRLTMSFGFLGATLIAGFIWASWHLPMLLFSNYNAGGDARFEMLSFVVMIIATSGVYAWLRLDSGSLWPAATMHASHNLFIQGLFDPLSARADTTITMVSEFGVVTAFVCVLACAPFWVIGARKFALRPTMKPQPVFQPSFNPFTARLRARRA